MNTVKKVLNVLLGVLLKTFLVLILGVFFAAMFGISLAVALWIFLTIALGLIVVAMIIGLSAIKKMMEGIFLKAIEMLAKAVIASTFIALVYAEVINISMIYADTANWISYLLVMPLFLIIYRMARKSQVTIPTAQVGVYTIFGRRTGKVKKEGLRFKWLCENIKLYDVQEETVKLSINTLTLDELKVGFNFGFKYRPDLTIKNFDGGTKYLDQKEDSAIDSVKGEITSVVTNTVQKIESKNLNKKALECYVDCVLRLKYPPHVHPLSIVEAVKDPEEKECFGEEIKKRFGETEIKDKKKRLEFYDEYSFLINELQNTEKERADEHSLIEEESALDIISSYMGEPVYDPETQKARESKEQIKKRKGEVFETTKAIKEEFADVSSEVAMNNALVLGGLAKKDVISVEGMKNDESGKEFARFAIIGKYEATRPEGGR